MNAEGKTARIGFAGAGNHATESLYPNVAHIPEFDLAAVCDLDEERATSAARRFGGRAAFTDVARMLDEVKLDGVCVCGPPEMHHEVGLQVLSRGLPVFVEKPPAPDLAGAEELAAVARDQGTIGMVGFMKRFAPANVVAREFMEGEQFGGLSSMTLMHGSGPYDEPRRMLLFNGIHLIDLARFLGGEITEVHAFGADERAPVQAVGASFRFRCGAVGQLNMNSGHTWDDCFELVYVSGREAGLVLDASQEVEVMTPTARFADAAGETLAPLRLFGWSGRYYVSGNMAGWHAGGHYTRGYWGELSHFARAILGEVEPQATLEDGVAAMGLIEAILRSSREGGVVGFGE